MPKKSERSKVGKILDAHGIRGEVYCFIFSGDSSWINEISCIWIADKKFEILKIRAHKKGFIATLKNVINRNQAEELKGSEVEVESSIFESEPGEEIYLTEIQNFKVSDHNLGDIGQISGFSSNGMQDLLIVTNNKKSYEIPFVEDFVLDIDYDKQIVLMNLPEGLLEINEKENVES